MSITYTMKCDDDLLVVEASGVDEDVSEVMAYGAAIVEAAAKEGCHRILCNELGLEYKLGTVDTYQAAAFIAECAPRVVRVALVCNPAGIEDGKFWETICVNRGLIVRVFPALEEARQWLADFK